MIVLGMNNFLSAQGFGNMSMLTVLIGAVLNIILDPIFIFALHQGVRGAAIATIILPGLFGCLGSAISDGLEGAVTPYT